MELTRGSTVQGRPCRLVKNPHCVETSLQYLQNAGALDLETTSCVD